MAQADQTVQNATFPTVRADINNNLAALFSDNSGSIEPRVNTPGHPPAVAYMDWIDTGQSIEPSSALPVWRKRNAANNAWVKLGTINGNAIAFEGTLPSQSGNSGKYLSTDGTVASWAALALGATVQTFTSSGTFTPTAGKTSFLVFATGGGGGGAGADEGGTGAGGGGGGTAARMYTSTEMGSTATVTVGAAGSAGSGTPTAGGAGGTTTFDPDGSGLTITGVGGSGSISGNSSGGGATNSQFAANGLPGSSDQSGTSNTSNGGGFGGGSFWGGGRGAGGAGARSGVGGSARNGTAGTAGGVFILEF